MPEEKGIEKKKEEGKISRQPFEQWALSAVDAFLKVADEKTWLKEIGFTLQILRNNAEAFAKCEPESIKQAVINVALTGATLNPTLQQAYLIPRAIKGKLRCCLDFGYRGLCKIALDSGAVLDIDATCVYEGDEFYQEKGLNPILKHVPTEGERGALKGVYAMAILRHGIKKFHYLNKDDIEKARKSSQAPNSLMWTDWYEEGARKTAVKRLYKLLPQTEKMSVAVEAVNEHEGLGEKEKAGEVVERRFGINRIKKEAPPAPETIEIEEKSPEVGTGSCLLDPATCGQSIADNHGNYGCALTKEDCVKKGK
ncbi:MAG: recombinase RecT [Endomicrobiia bacterium]|nr:recombinase RecT [Endomicrobiia bacterium]